MAGPPPGVAATRVAVRPWLAQAGPGGRAVVAVSGGADSLALAAAVADEAGMAGCVVSAVVVDHQLQRGSREVAQQAAQACRRLGIEDVAVIPVVVEGGGSDGPEAAARDARYGCLSDYAAIHRAAVVLLGHTLDDQAEQVLLGLVRGSGTRSASGMPSRRGIFGRPFLGLRRAVTLAACAERGLSPWDDPHNGDAAFRRTAARAALASLEGLLGESVALGLGRSAALLRADADYLDEVAADERGRLGAGPSYEVGDLAALPEAIRRRVWRLLAVEAGSAPGSLTSRHVDALDALVTHWRGQGAVSLPGGHRIARSGSLVLSE